MSRSAFFDQGLQVGLEACAVLTRMLQNQLDQATLARAKVSMDPTARQAVKQRDRLLGEELCELVGGHVVPVTGTAREKREMREEQEGSNKLPRRVPPFSQVSRFPRLRDTSDALMAIPPARLGG